MYLQDIVSLRLRLVLTVLVEIDENGEDEGGSGVLHRELQGRHLLANICSVSSS